MNNDQQAKFRLIALAAIIAALPAALVAAPAANTLPTGATVVNGNVVISNPSTGLLQITNSAGSIINWNSFSIGSGAAVKFLQQNTSSAVLNRVTGSGGSEIYGQLASNGRVFLINTNGIIFGAGSRVDVSGLIASTRDISNANFLAGNYLFEGSGGGNILLEKDALIRTNTAQGGQVWLFANRIDTQAGSSVQTPKGQTVLAAGDRITVGDTGSGYMSFSVAANAGQTIEHFGEIAAERGAAGLFADSIVIGGKVNVASAGFEPGGAIHVAAARDITLRDGARLDASGGQSGSGGRINLDAGNRVEIARGADVSADGGSNGAPGGRIDIAGNEVLIEPGLGGIASVHAAGTNAAADGSVNIVRRAAPTGAISSYLAVSATGGSDYYPSVAFLDDGGFVAVWMEQNAPAGTIWSVDYSTIYARHFNATGQPVSAPFQVSTVSNFQYDPKVIGLDGGGFFIVWAYKDARPAPGTLGWEPHLGKLYGRMFNANGVAVGGDVKISNDFGESDAARIVQLAGGNFIVTWNNETSNYPQPFVLGKRGQLFDATGTMIGTPLSLLPATTANGAMKPALSYIVPLSDGGFAQVYQRSQVDSSGYPTTSTVFVQRYSNTGVATGNEIQLGTSQTKFFLESATSLANGDIVVALRTEDPVTKAYKLYYGVYGANGSAKRVDQALNVTANSLYSRLTALADGGFAALWKSSPTANGTNMDTYTRRFAADGTPIEAARALTNVPQVTGIDQTVIAARSDGAYLAAWSENTQVSGGYTAYEIRAGLITPTPVPTAGTAPINGNLAGNIAYDTRPGLANGTLEPPPAPVPAPTPVPATPATPPKPVTPSHTGQQVRPPVPVIPAVPATPATQGFGAGPATPASPAKGNDDKNDKASRQPKNTESALNEDRRLTPSGQNDFVFPGQSKVFADTTEVRAVVDAQGKVTQYVIETKPVENEAAKR